MSLTSWRSCAPIEDDIQAVLSQPSRICESCRCRSCRLGRRAIDRGQPAQRADCAAHRDFRRPGSRRDRRECQGLHDAHARAARGGASGEEAIKGSIAVGKLADDVVLADDLRAAPPEKIKDIQIVRTVVGGRTSHQA